MKLIQLNMWAGRLARQIIPFIQEESPDIITAQEVFSSERKILYPTDTFDLVQLIQKAGNYPHVYFSPIWSMEVTHQQVGYGNAIFSKHPFVSQETIFTNNSFQPDITVENFIPNTYNAQFVEINIDGKKLHIINHHGWWEKSPKGSDESVKKMELIVDKISALPREEPIIFAGDLNLQSGSSALRLLDPLLEDLVVAYGVADTLSQFGKVTNVACDHVFINKPVLVNKFQALDALVSDHKALMLDFDLS